MYERIDRQHEAAERVEMRRWLARKGRLAAQGQEPEDTAQLIRQVDAAGGDPIRLMKRGREQVNMRRCACQRGSTCDMSHDPSLCTCQQCRTATAATATAETAG